MFFSAKVLPRLSDFLLVTLTFILFLCERILQKVTVFLFVICEVYVLGWLCSQSQQEMEEVMWLVLQGCFVEKWAHGRGTGDSGGIDLRFLRCQPAVFCLWLATRTISHMVEGLVQWGATWKMSSLVKPIRGRVWCCHRRVCTFTFTLVQRPSAGRASKWNRLIQYMASGGLLIQFIKMFLLTQRQQRSCFFFIQCEGNMGRMGNQTELPFTAHTRVSFWPSLYKTLSSLPPALTADSPCSVWLYVLDYLLNPSYYEMIPSITPEYTQKYGPTDTHAR